MKTKNVCLLLLILSLFMPGCSVIYPILLESPKPEYVLETNGDYVFLWDRNDVKMEHNWGQPFMIGSPGKIVLRGWVGKNLLQKTYALDSLSGNDVTPITRLGCEIIVDGEYLYTGTCGQARVISYNIQSGELLWETSFPWEKSVSSLYAAEDKIFVYTSTSNFFVLNKNGEIIKNFHSTKSVYLEINNVLYMNDVLAIRAVDASSMQELWRVDVGSYDTAPIVDGETIFVTAWKNIHSIEQATGKITWSVPNDAVGNLYITDRKIYYISKDSSLVSLDRAMGNEISRVKFLPEFDIRAPYIGGYYVAGDPSNDVIVVSFINSNQIIAFKVVNP
ncbi:MAG: PQQ-like beta-propeller repeat protein [Anaerolineae bacterium]|nr:PQQ-like beta-propeller repeat protein [Anaerolineae bacterium]